MCLVWRRFIPGNLIARNLNNLAHHLGFNLDSIEFKVSGRSV